MKISFSRKFRRQYDRAGQKIQTAVKVRIALFKADPIHPSLNIHSLRGKYSGYRSMNITGDWRAIFKESRLSDDNPNITFEMLGTHSQLYK